MPIPLIASVLAAAAPELAQRGFDLLSGIFRGAAKLGADKIAKAVKDKTGIDVAPQVQDVADLIKKQTGISVSDIADNKLTDDQWSKLKEFELQHEAQLQQTQLAVSQNEAEMEKLLNEDRASARTAQTERDKNDDKFVRRFTYIYAYLITGLTFAFIFFVIWMSVVPADQTDKKVISADAWRLIDTVLGFLMGVGLSAIIQFFYGSSQGSREKTEVLKRIVSASDSSQG